MNKKLWNVALILAVITVFYNIIEGVVSVAFGYSDETLSLFGFGLDSFVEVLSGIGIWHMIIRVGKRSDLRDSFEKTALKITGISFYLLSIGLAATAVVNTITQSKPETTLWGMVIATISILTMFFLMSAKLRVGRSLQSDALIADANCTRTCIYLSVILLVSSVVYHFTKIGYVDALGAIGIAYYAFKEGRESMDKAKGKACGCCG